MPPTRVTLADVAGKAGVSTAAASYALNGRPGVSDVTRLRVMDVAELLGWHPDAGGRALARSRADVVGLIVARPARLLGTDPFFSVFLAGVEEALATQQVGLLLRVVNEKHNERTAYERLGRSHAVDGFIVTDFRTRDFRLRLLNDLAVPAVVLGRPTSGYGSDACGWVWYDDRCGVREGVEHLHSNGHRRIGYVSGPLDYRHARSRAQAWRRSLVTLGLTSGALRQADLEEADFTPEGGAAATKRLLDSPRQPTAIVYGNDLMALAGMAVIADYGLRIPQDVSVIGFDDIPLAAHSRPPLSTVAADVSSWGRAAATALLDHIDNGRMGRIRLAPSRLILRGSTAPRHHDVKSCPAARGLATN